MYILVYLLIKIIQILNIIYLHVQMNEKMVYVIKQWVKNVNCQYRENKPISKETIYKHMYGNYPIGIYPLLENISFFEDLLF